MSYSAKRVLLIYNGPESGTSGRLFTALLSFISQRHACRLRSNKDKGGRVFSRLLFTIFEPLRRIADVWWADTIIVHSNLVLSWDAILFGRLFGKRIVGFVWDLYPSTIAGQPIKSNSLHNLIGFADRLLQRILTISVLPSCDFDEFIKAREIVHMPLWFKDDSFAPQRRMSRDHPAGLNICFAGQINLIRGLEQFISFAQAHSQTKLILHIFSDRKAQQLEELGGDKVRIQYHEKCSPEDLLEELKAMDFGLVSLHPKFDQVGFPSKTFDYVQAGLPLIYFGRSMPAYEALLENTRIGYVVKAGQDVNLESVLADISSTYSDARRSFIAETNLNWSALEKVL